MDELSASEQIDRIIASQDPWKQVLLTKVRATITNTAPTITEEVKWKMPSRPAGLPVWSQNGVVCIAEIFKNDIKIVFFKGAQLQPTHPIFNARLKSRTDRAIELKEGSTIDEKAFAALIIDAVKLNSK